MSIIRDPIFEAWHNLARTHRLPLSGLASELQDKHDLSLARFEALAHLNRQVSRGGCTSSPTPGPP